MKKFFHCLSSFVIAFLFSLFGLAWQTMDPKSLPHTLLLLLGLLPIPLLLLSRLLAKRAVTKIKAVKIKERQSYMLAHRAEAERMSHILLRRLQWLRRGTTVYAVLLFLFAVCISVYGGAMYNTLVYLHYLCVLYAGAVFYAVLSRVHRERTAPASDGQALPLAKEDFPRLYAVAERAAKALDCRGKVVLGLCPDDNASIYQNDYGYFLRIGVLLLGVMSEEELYSIFLHEFSHCSKKNRAAKRELRHGHWIANGQEVYPFMRFATNLFVYADLCYLFNHMTYEYATSVRMELDADRDMAKHGSPAVCAAALLKVCAHNLYAWETAGVGEPSPFACEEQPAHYLRDKIEPFRAAIEARGADWCAMLGREILANNASHPTLRMRLETLGVTEVGFTAGESSAEYQAEVARAIDTLDEKMLFPDELYQRAREERYLAPLSRIEEWQAQGMPIAAETYADLFDDLKLLGRYEEAEALCDRVIAELDENSTWNACFQKGCLLLFRYDERGLELVYRAIEKNLNFLEEGSEIIGRFCCITGREEALQFYRERITAFAQRDQDEYEKTSYIAKGDDLSRDEDISPEMKESILAYIREIDGAGIIHRVYLVRKRITESFATSAFVIHFYGGSEGDREEIMHKIFLYLDNYPVDWQFSLLDFFECRGVRLDKIEGALVFEREKQ